MLIEVVETHRDTFPTELGDFDAADPPPALVFDGRVRVDSGVVERLTPDALSSCRFFVLYTIVYQGVGRTDWRQEVRAVTGLPAELALPEPPSDVIRHDPGATGLPFPVALSPFARTGEARPARARQVVMLRDFTGTARARAAGVCRPSSRLIYLNTAGWTRTGRYPFNSGQRRMKETAAHEFFHGIQMSFDAREAKWVKKSTANWAANRVFPEVRKCLGAERVYLRYPHLSPHLEVRGVAATHGGRPYGTSLLMRSLELEMGPGTIHRLWDAWGATAGPNEFEALAELLGDDAPLGSRFRDLYRRFVAGVLLRTKAPADCRPPDAGSRATCPTTSSPWTSRSWRTRGRSGCSRHSTGAGTGA